MTQANRETQYKNLKIMSETYEALPHLNKGLTSTTNVRARAKKVCEAMLANSNDPKNSKVSLEIKPEPVKPKSKEKK